MVKCNTVNVACFIFCLTAALLSLFMEFCLTWVHYTSSFEPMDFGLLKVCHLLKDVDKESVNHCFYSEFWMYLEMCYFPGILQTYALPLICVNIGIVSCILCAFLSNPFMHCFKGRTCVKLLTPVLSLISGFFFIVSYSLICFSYHGYFRLDPNYLHLGQVCYAFPAVIICSVIALTCQLITGYPDNLNNLFVFKWLGQFINFVGTGTRILPKNNQLSKGNHLSTSSQKNLIWNQ